MTKVFPLYKRALKQLLYAHSESLDGILSDHFISQIIEDSPNIRFSQRLFCSRI